MSKDCIYFEFCAYDCSGCSFENLNNWENIPFYLEKDRATSRKRHLNKVKAKKKAIINAQILSSKSDKVAEIVPWETPPRLQLRALKALKKSQRYKKFYKTEL